MSPEALAAGDPGPAPGHSESPLAIATLPWPALDLPLSPQDYNPKTIPPNLCHPRLYHRG